MTDPQKLGKYMIHEVLGRGAMGVVYKGFDPHIERIVALKTIRKDRLDPETAQALLARFKREAQAAGRLNHANIVTVFEYGEDEGTAFIAMEYVEGRTLKEIFAAGERFTVRAALQTMAQLLDALGYSHRQGVVHRDIKPANIIVLPTGRIKVTDFGIAHLENSNLTQFGEVLGTPSCMSPEQCMGDTVDKRSDLFSAGVIFYQLLTGEKPFPGESMTTIMHRVINVDPLEPSRLNLKLPIPLDRCVLKALAKKPEDRFQSAEEFFAALKAAAKGGDMAAAPAPAASGGGEATVREPAVVVGDETVREGGRPSEGRGFAFSGDILQGKRLLLPLVAVIIILGLGLVWLLLRAPSSRQEVMPQMAAPQVPAAPAKPVVKEESGESAATAPVVPEKTVTESPASKPRVATPGKSKTVTAPLPGKPQEGVRVRLTTKPRTTAEPVEEPKPAPVTNKIIGTRPKATDR
ncbi:protein kinase domain-containing protein [Thiovibrio sp. JS02]